MATDTHKHLRTCPLCEGMCGVEVTVQDHQILSVRPDRDDAWSHGHICPKGTTLGELHHDPDRLHMPLVRDGNEWRETSWDEAFERCEELLQNVREKYGHHTISGYFGNMLGKSFGIGHYNALFFQVADLKSVYSSATVDQQPKNLSSHLMYGDMWRIPIPDIDNTDLWVIFGANPAASKGSILSHRNVMEALKNIRKRGGKVIVIDPVNTTTAQKSDQWIPIRPGADAALLLGVAHTLFHEKLVRLGHLATLVNGLDSVRELALQFPPETVQHYCGVDATTIRELARTIAQAPTAAVYGRIGLCTQEFGTLASWLIDVIAILSGNFDRIGGLMWSKPATAHLGLTNNSYPINYPLVTGKTRVRGAPIILGQGPASCLAEEIATPGEGQIKGLITAAANPALSAPDSGLLAQALPQLECMISLDVYLNETTRHAHVILPSQSLVEQPYWDFWSWIFALRSGGKFSPALFKRPNNHPDDWQILLRLGWLISGNDNASFDLDQLDDDYFHRLCNSAGVDPAQATAMYDGRGPERILDLAIRTGPFGDSYGKKPDGMNLQTYRDAPHGIDLGPAQEQVVKSVLKTESKKIELAPDHILQDIPRLQYAIKQQDWPELVLVSRRHLASMNSWLHNVDTLMRGRDKCTLLIHPDDAERKGISHGDDVEVSRGKNALTIVAEVTADISRGVVSIPHGWGHNADGAKLNVAKRQPGVNSNLLSPGLFVDVPSGNAVLNGIPVIIAKA
ncbi:MAG: molybdopterin-dependent oxidoreductase [Spongiibacteraceae bacterium]